jgi:hypothetical protein
MKRSDERVGPAGQEGEPLAAFVEAPDARKGADFLAGDLEPPIGRTPGIGIFAGPRPAKEVKGTRHRWVGLVDFQNGLSRVAYVGDPASGSRRAASAARHFR